MIDEKKLISVVEKRQEYWETNAAEFDKKHDLINMDICDGKATELDCIMKLINDQPKVGEWIPCSERLPEKHEHVLITWKDGEHYHATEAIYGRNGWLNYSPNELPHDIEVVAWQTLPEPWGGVEE